jgi:hypothetical protein
MYIHFFETDTLRTQQLRLAAQTLQLQYISTLNSAFYIYCIYSLLYDASRSSDYTKSNGMIMSEQWTQKDVVNCDILCGNTWKIIDIIPEFFSVKCWLDQQVLISILTTNMRMQFIKVER